MTASAASPDDGALAVPAALRAAVYLWLLTVPVCLALGLNGVMSLVSVVQDPSPTSTAASSGESRTLIVVLAVLSAAIQAGFAATPLAYAFTLRRPGRAGHRARSILAVLAALGLAATVIGYLAGGIVPFAGGKSAHDLLHDSLEALWLLAALTATALAFTGAARRHQQRRPPPT